MHEESTYWSRTAETGGLIHHSGSWFQQSLAELDLVKRCLKECYIRHEQQRAQQLALARLQAGHFPPAPTSILSLESNKAKGRDTLHSDSKR